MSFYSRIWFTMSLVTMCLPPVKGRIPDRLSSVALLKSSVALVVFAVCSVVWALGFSQSKLMGVVLVIWLRKRRKACEAVKL